MTQTPPSVEDLPALRAWLADKTLMASVSGGKDSAALSLWLHETGLEHLRVFADTGWEHELLYHHVREVLPKHIGAIQEVRNDRLMEEESLYRSMLPMRMSRWCTHQLKAEPIRKFIAGLQDDGHEVVDVIGIRAGESNARAQMAEWEWNKNFDCWMWRPLIRWSTQDVVDIHHRTGTPLCALYGPGYGATRVGCWPCIFARKSEIRMIADTDPGRINRLRILEQRVNDKVAQKIAAEGMKKDQAPSQRTWFRTRGEGKGGAAAWPIDDVVKWARGGDQIELFAPDHGADGCMRYGLCDHPAEEEDMHC